LTSLVVFLQRVNTFYKLLTALTKWSHPRAGRREETDAYSFVSAALGEICDLIPGHAFGTQPRSRLQTNVPPAASKHSTLSTTPPGHKHPGTEPVGRLPPGECVAKTVEIEINHGRGEQGQQLADQEAVHDRDAKRFPQFGPAPQPSAVGIARSNAHIVVIIGRNPRPVSSNAVITTRALQPLKEEASA
jgi:hypothetical protein